MFPAEIFFTFIYLEQLLKIKRLHKNAPLSGIFVEKNLGLNIKRLIFAPRKWSRSSAG